MLGIFEVIFDLFVVEYCVLIIFFDDCNKLDSYEKVYEIEDI